MLHGGVVGDVQSQGRLAHAGPRRQDDEVGRTQPFSLLVQILEAGEDAAAGGVVFCGRDALEGLADDLFQGLEVARAALLGDGEEQLLGPVEQDVHVVGVAVAHVGDLVADLHELAEDALLADDLGVVDHCRGGRHALGQGVHELAAADFLQDRLAV